MKPPSEFPPLVSAPLKKTPESNTLDDPFNFLARDSFVTLMNSGGGFGKVSSNLRPDMTRGH